MWDSPVDMKNIEDKITNTKEAEGFFKMLKENDKLFHLDDDPFDCLKSGRNRTFTDSEASHITERVKELFCVFSDPFEMLMSAVESDQ